jgi:hypothetical protein
MGESDSYMHIFLDAGNSSVLALFELPAKAPTGRTPNTTDWPGCRYASTRRRRQPLDEAKALLASWGSTHAMEFAIEVRAVEIRRPCARAG